MGSSVFETHKLRIYVRAGEKLHAFSFLNPLCIILKRKRAPLIMYRRKRGEVFACPR